MARGTGKSGVEVAQEHVDALETYLENLGDQPLPRYGGIAGLERVAFDLLDRRDLNDNKMLGPDQYTTR